MKKEISPTGHITLKEGVKSARDAALISLGGLLPVLLEVATTVDFGQYTAAVSVIVSMLMPLCNRLLRNKK